LSEEFSAAETICIATSFFAGLSRFTPLLGGAVVGAVVGVEVPPGSVHFWLAVLPQVQICRRLPLAELLSVASRHLPEPLLTSVLPVPAVHFWAAVPLQS
jgi:hypothetical protein